ncbi:MAG: hypothetical protein CME19_03150 [Gemmatimonadetes bacterium]|nr:hypothetical protein [Gemmatimonadota bacterium]
MALPSLQYDRFYTTDEIVTFLGELTEARPDLCRLGILGQPRAGTDIPFLTLTDFTPEDAAIRPAMLIHGGIHAHEPASAHGPLYTARRLIEDHTHDGLLTQVAFHILPRLTVDASDFCISTSTRVRSRTDFDNQEPDVIYPEDIDGNGLILKMRQSHPDGYYVTDPQDPRLLIRRQPESPPPYYRTFPEGLIHDWSGTDAVRRAGWDSFYPDQPELAGGRNYDWNRNWPHNWRADQVGAGEHPLSEPEVQLVHDHLVEHLEISVVLGYHTGKASVIRPPASGSRSDLDPEDDRVLQELAELGASLTGTPILSLVGPGNRGKGGHALDTLHYRLKRLAFEIELGTVLNDAGLSPDEELTLDRPGEEDWMRRLLRWWDARGQDFPLCEPWTPWTHPQLGEVELGGLHDTTLDNPLVSGLETTLEGRHQFTLELAQRHCR